jgi:hypothetical protein
MALRSWSAATTEDGGQENYGEREGAPAGRLGLIFEPPAG